MDNMQTSAMSTESTMSSKPAASGWSWGGFMFPPVVIFAAKKYIWVLLYLLLFIPFIGWLIPMIVMGLKGRNLMMSSGALSGEEAKGFMKGIDHAGKIMFWILIIIAAIGIIFGLIAGVSFLGAMGGLINGSHQLDLNQMPTGTMQY